MDKCRLCWGSGEHFYDLCPICGGHGEVDWIQQIVGATKDQYKFKSIEAKRLADEAMSTMHSCRGNINRALMQSDDVNRAAISEYVRRELRMLNLGDLRVDTAYNSREDTIQISAHFNLLEEYYGITISCPMH